jgi:hypothetical protein
MLLC